MERRGYFFTQLKIVVFEDVLRPLKRFRERNIVKVLFFKTQPFV